MNEADYYKPVKAKIEEMLKDKVNDVYFEITATGNFSPKIKEKIPQNREIIFSFLKKSAAPDITGFVQRQYSTDFIIIEVKKELKLDGIYQTMRYRDLFDSKYTFLVSLKPIPEEIKRFCNIAYILHSPSIYRFFVLAQFNEKTNNFVEWHEENPFEKELYWR